MAPASPDEPQEELRCDFCGGSSSHVRRIALDDGYDRLHRPHQEQYACPDCSRDKEARRQGGA
ncbi:MAG: hypothetical protein QNK05_16705 [Myxococcota bacterium]|nr:hypothetical protein [Myxococcota bacterium]